jgi:hypothetical protein
MSSVPSSSMPLISVMIALAARRRPWEASPPKAVAPVINPNRPVGPPVTPGLGGLWGRPCTPSRPLVG